MRTNEEALVGILEAVIDGVGREADAVIAVMKQSDGDAVATALLNARLEGLKRAMEIIDQAMESAKKEAA